MEYLQLPSLEVRPKLDDLTHLIEEYSNIPLDIKDQAFPDLLSRLSDRTYLIPLLREIINSPKDLGIIASQSYRHVNLFDKIVLVDSNDPSMFRLTLHFWCPPFTAKELNEELIHEHRFNFWSKILLGTLHSECFVESDEGDAYQAYRYFPSQESNDTFQDYYQFVKNVKLFRKTPSQRQCGETYFLSAPTIHRINISVDELCCTLVLRGPRLRDYSLVYNTSYPTGDTRITNRMFTPEELTTKLRTLIKKLEMSADYSG